MGIKQGLQWMKMYEEVANITAVCKYFGISIVCGSRSQQAVARIILQEVLKLILCLNAIYENQLL